MRSKNRVIGFCVVGVLLTLNIASADLVIEGPEDIYTEMGFGEGQTGDYTRIAGVSIDVSPGQQFDVLTVASGDNGISIMDMHPIGDLVDTLADGGITSSDILAFGITVNETGGVDNFLNIVDLSMTFDTPGGGSQTYDLGDDIQIFNFVQAGNSDNDGQVWVDLGYDFLNSYSAAELSNPNVKYSISATFVNGDNGPDVIHLDSGLTSAVPEPGAMLLTGFVGLIMASGTFLKKKLISD